MPTCSMMTASSPFEEVLIGAEQISMAEKFWNYRYITKPTIDYSGMTFSADVGVLAKYKVADILTLDISVVNGRGYKELTPDNTLKVVTGFTLTPAKNLLFRGYYDLMGPGGNRQSTGSLTGAYIGNTFTLGAEYLMQNNHLMASRGKLLRNKHFHSSKICGKISQFSQGMTTSAQSLPKVKLNHGTSVNDGQ